MAFGGFDLAFFILVLIGLVVGLTVHEASHALVADRLGDPTARRLGRVTLNPLAHLDPTGTLLIIFSSLAGVGFGWGKPCPVNPNNLRVGPKTGMALVAAAGPVSNLVTAAILAGVMKSQLGLPPELIAVLDIVARVNVSLAFFNLIPIPPLDGFSVLLGLLPDRFAYSLAPIQQYGPALLLLLVFLGQGYIGRFIGLFSGPYMGLIGLA
jgi:Zn-dependent protease